MNRELWLDLDDCAERMELEGLHDSEGYKKLKSILAAQRETVPEWKGDTVKVGGPVKVTYT